ncbi:MAG: hypothetical protein HXY23_14290 [Parvularculaceae bacterium]|nr:hypothetical protein [Parvularculaceae bacterium]
MKRLLLLLLLPTAVFAQSFPVRVRLEVDTIKTLTQPSVLNILDSLRVAGIITADGLTVDGVLSSSDSIFTQSNIFADGNGTFFGNLRVVGTVDFDSVYSTTTSSNRANLYIGADGKLKRTTDTTSASSGGWTSYTPRVYTSTAGDSVNIRTAAGDTTGGGALFTNWGTTRLVGPVMGNISVTDTLISGLETVSAGVVKLLDGASGFNVLKATNAVTGRVWSLPGITGEIAMMSTANAGDFGISGSGTFGSVLTDTAYNPIGELVLADSVRVTKHFFADTSRSQTPANQFYVDDTLSVLRLRLANGAVANYVLTTDASGYASWQPILSVLGVGDTIIVGGSGDDALLEVFDSFPEIILRANVDSVFVNSQAGAALGTIFRVDRSTGSVYSYSHVVLNDVSVGDSLSVTGSGTFGSDIMVGDSSNYVSISDEQGVTLVGEATVWDDLRGTSISGKQGQTSKPEFDYDSLTVLFPQDSTEILYFEFQMPHTWKAGSTVYPHAHYKQAAAHGVAPGDTTVFAIEYKWYALGGRADLAGWSYYRMNRPEYAYTSGILHQLNDGDGGIDGTGKNHSSIILIKLKRLNAGGPVGNVELLSLDIHYEVNAMGGDVIP